MDVFLLWHVNELPNGEEDAKLIGVYATADDAERARLRVSGQPGFCDSPEGFLVVPYEVGRDHWTEGFGTCEASMIDNVRPLRPEELKTSAVDQDADDQARPQP